MNEAERYLREHSQTHTDWPHASTAISGRKVPEPPDVEPTGQQVVVSCGTAWKQFWTRWSFKGRSSRSEYWWMFFTLHFPVNFLNGFAEGAAEYSGSSGVVWAGLALLCLIIGVVALVPSVSIAVRRLHDSNRSAWWLLINFVPFVGFLIFLVMLLLPSEPKPNRFGPVPNVR